METVKKKKGESVEYFRGLTQSNLINLANDLDDQIGDLLIDEEQINKEAGFDKIAAWRSLAAFLRDEAKGRKKGRT